MFECLFTKDTFQKDKIRKGHPQCLIRLKYLGKKKSRLKDGINSVNILLHYTYLGVDINIQK